MTLGINKNQLAQLSSGVGKAERNSGSGCSIGHTGPGDEALMQFIRFVLQASVRQCQTEARCFKCQALTGFLRNFRPLGFH